MTTRDLHGTPNSDSDSDSDGVGAGVGVLKKFFFGVGVGVGVNFFFPESELELVHFYENSEKFFFILFTHTTCLFFMIMKLILKKNLSVQQSSKVK